MDISEQSQLTYDQLDAKVRELCMLSEANFDEWTSLVAEIEKTSPDMEKISLVYNSFLSEFPLCYGYWRKYAGHKARICTVDEVVEVYERAVQLATYSVHMWVDYCSFGMLLFEDPANVRRLFERGISLVGKDYLCNLLWDKYIEFEYSQKKWSSLAHVYIRTLKYPTKKLRSYYDSFKMLAGFWEEEIKFQSNDAAEVQSDGIPNGAKCHDKAYDDEDMIFVIKDLLDPAIGLCRLNALQKYLSTGEKFYQKASELDAKISFFESCINRPYFHVKPLDDRQLENWHHYLDFVESYGDFDWTVKLHERCLIPCANYPEFWIRYTEFMETKGGREIATLALVRATQIFLKRVPAIHLFCARFKEKRGDIFGSRAAFRQCNRELDLDFIENVRREANMENRLGNLEAAFLVYEEALQKAIEKPKSDILSMLSLHFSRYKYKVTGNVDASRDVLIKGIQHLPYCKLLVQELLNFEMTHKGPKQMNVVKRIVTQAICSGSDLCEGLSNKDREDISSLYLEFMDHCGTIDDVMKAWNRHRKLFPHVMRCASYDHTARTRDTLIALPHHASRDEKLQDSSQALQLDQNASQPENQVQPDYGPTVQSQEELQPFRSPGVMDHAGEDINKLNMEANNLVDEVANDHQALVTAQESPKGLSQVQKSSDYDSNDGLASSSLATLSLSPHNDGTQVSNPTISHDRGTPRETPISNGSRQHGGDISNEISSLSSLTSTKSSNDSDSLELHPRTQSLLPTGSTSIHGAGSKENWYGMNNSGKTECDANATPGIPVSHGTQRPQQLQSSLQPQYQLSSMHPQTFGPSQPQIWQNSPLQPSNQPPNQHQLSAAQVQLMSTYQWPAQNMQQQYFVPAPQPQPISQPVAYPHPHAYQHPMQSNVQYGHMQGNQAFNPQMWHYYYQQQQQLQQQQIQQLTTLQTQSWNNIFYQQQPLVQQYGSSQYGQEYRQQGQVVTQQSTEASGLSVSPCPQQDPPPNQSNPAPT